MHVGRALQTTVLLVAATALGASVAVHSQTDLAQPPGRDWPLWGGGWSNTRYSTLTQITPQNVSSLGGAWMRHLNGEQVQAVPVVRNGLMFVPTVAQHLYALDAKTGEIVWKYESALGRRAGGFPLKGVALGEGLVFLPQADTRIIALRQDSGEVVWSAKIGLDDAPGRESLNAAPVHAAGLVISGVGGGDGGIRGHVTALDAATGEQVWRFFTIPGPGEPGHETWPDNDAWRRGGGAVWAMPAVDIDRGLVYINTGNAWPNWVGDERAGNNLFTASIVALDLRTGEYRWHQQLVHHDIWDLDAAMSLVLFDTEVDGQLRKGIATFRPDGYLFRFDRETGEPLGAIEERPVKQEPRQRTAATQPYPVSVDQVVPNCVSEETGLPGFVLGCFFDPVYADLPNLLVPASATRHAPMSYSPQTGYFYSVANVHVNQMTRRNDPPGGGIRTPPGLSSHGVLTATDGRTGKIVWQQRLPHRAAFGSGTTATAGGLVFHGHPDGRLMAYDARSGDLLWEFQTGFGVDATPMSYAVDGEQYVAVTAGGSFFSGGAMGDAVWAFRVGGELPPALDPTAPPTTQPFGGAIADAYQVELGPTASTTTLGPGGFGVASNDEYTVSPPRIRIAVGSPVTWTNTGAMVHRVRASAGSWSTGPIPPGGSATVNFDAPGTYDYVCEEHPWTMGQVIVE